jgi:exonuclease III
VIIATWNAARGRPEKKLPILQDRYNVDIAAIQEIGKPKDPIASQSVWTGTNPHIGVMTYAQESFDLQPIEKVPFETELYSAVRVSRDGEHLFNILNLWVKPDGRSYTDSLFMGLDAAMSQFGAQLTVVMGDTNIIDPHTKDFLQGYLAAFGMTSAYHLFHNEVSGEESRPTHKHRLQKTLHHIDFCCLPCEWEDAIKSVDVGTEEEWGAFSDHFPIVVDVDDAVLDQDYPQSKCDS